MFKNNKKICNNKKIKKINEPIKCLNKHLINYFSKIPNNIVIQILIGSIILQHRC